LVPSVSSVSGIEHDRIDNLPLFKEAVRFSCLRVGSNCQTRSPMASLSFGN
jgi:hypothetical protein